jgi:hypothetical protein
MNTVGRLASAFLATILATGLAACTPRASKPAASPSAADPLAKLTATEILDKATTDTVNAPDVEFSLAGLSEGRNLNATLKIVRGRACEGNVYESSTGSVQLITLGQVLWIKPDAMFWENAVTGGPASLQALAGKYLQVSSINAAGSITTLAALCDLSDALREPVTGAGKLTKDGLSPLDGRQVMTILDDAKAGTGYAVVTDSSKPLLLQVSPPPGSPLSEMTFDDYDQPFTITPPPTSEVVDGAKYGL